MVKGPSKERFEQIFSTGKRVSRELARLTSLPGTGLIGVTTTKRLGGKPQRNREKRRFREAIRTQPDLVKSHLDYVILVNQSASEATFERIQTEVRALFGEAESRWASELESS